MTEARLVQRLKISNWITLAVLVAAGAILVGGSFAISVLLGGLLIIINFGLLHRVLRGTLNPLAPKPAGLVVFAYFARLAGTGAVLLVLIWLGAASPLGLIVGLSTVVISLVTGGFFVIRQERIKEA